MCGFSGGDTPASPTIPGLVVMAGFSGVDEYIVALVLGFSRSNGGFSMATVGFSRAGLGFSGGGTCGRSGGGILGRSWRRVGLDDRSGFGLPDPSNGEAGSGAERRGVMFPLVWPFPPLDKDFPNTGCRSGAESDGGRGAGGFFGPLFKVPGLALDDDILSCL